MFFLEIKFYVRKEGSLNKYYCRKSKLTGFFEKLLRTYYLLLSSDASICSTVALRTLGNFYCVVASVFIDFPLNSKRDPSFHRTAYDYFHAE